MTIDLSLTRDLFPLFYQLAFFVFMIMLIAEGIKRRYPLTAWLLICTLVTGFIILGSKIGSYTPDQIAGIFREGALPPFGRKSDIGAGISMLIGVWLAGRIMGFRSPVFPALAFALPLIIFIQRIGCLMAGCTFGNPVHHHWGIQYAGAGMLRDLQMYRGEIPFDSLQTAPVHPVPVYFMLGSLLTIAVLLAVRKRLRAPNSLFLLSLTLIASTRFLIEFFRDPASNLMLGDTMLGLKAVQWVLLLFAISMAFLIFLTERKPLRSYPPEQVNLNRSLIAIAAICFVLLVLRHWFTREEIVVLHVQTGVAAIGLLAYLVQHRRRFSYKAVSALTILGSFFLMGLTYTDTSRTQVSTDSAVWILLPDTLQNDLDKKGFILVNITSANLVNTGYPCKTVSSGCFGDYCSSEDLSSPMGPGYMSYSLEFEHRETKRKTPMIYGVQGQIESYRNKPSSYHTQRGNIYPFLGIDSRYVGLRFGFRVGSMFHDKLKNKGNNTFMPAGKLWVGDPDSFIFEGGLFDNELSGAGPVYFHAKIDFMLHNKRWAMPGSIGASWGFGNLFGNTGIGNIFVVNGGIPFGRNYRLNPGFGLYTTEGQTGLAATLGLKSRIY